MFWAMCFCPRAVLFLCTGASAGDFRKSSSFLMNGFFEETHSFFSCRFLLGIQFLGRSFSSCSMVQISKTSPSLQSFSANATTWSSGRWRCSGWLKLTMTNGVTVFCSLSFRSAIMGICGICWGFALSQSWARMTSTLVSSVVLMSTSTTAQDRGGTLMLLFSDTDDLESVWYSVVSAMTSLFCVSWQVLGFWVHDIPIQFLDCEISTKNHGSLKVFAYYECLIKGPIVNVDLAFRSASCT